MDVARTFAATDGPAAPSITLTGTSLGTPAYMAPEQAAGDADADQRADIYAWGVVAYEVLAGKHPFAGRTSPRALMAAHFGETPVALASTTAGHVSRALSDLVMRCLAKDPADRPSTAAELIAVLDGASGARSTTNARWREPIPLLAVVLGAVLGAIAFAWWRTPNVDRAVAPGTGPVMMAVLPFEHAGPTDQQPFTDGLTDAVTAKLAGLTSLAVIDRRSAATYRGTTKSAKKIGAELGVRYLLEGVVRWAKDGAGVWKARVTPTLVDAGTGVTKWTGEAQDITLDDPFTAQGQIASEVASAMEIAVLPAEQTELERPLSRIAQALAAYQRGVALADRAGEGGNSVPREQAIMEFERAIALDSNFALAWGQLAKELTYLASSVSDSSYLSRVRTTSRTHCATRRRIPWFS